MVKKANICKKCGFIFDDPEAKECAICGNTKFTTFWQGYTIVIDPEKSEVAKILSIAHKGKFALRIN